MMQPCIQGATTDGTVTVLYRECNGAPPTNAAHCDSMCVDSQGSVCQATIANGGITVSPTNGSDLWHVPTNDYFTSNCCFGGAGLRSLYVTLGISGQLVAFDKWPVAGHRLNF